MRLEVKEKSRSQLEKEYRESLKSMYKAKDFILAMIIVVGIMILMFGLIEAELWVGSLVDSIIH